MSGRGKGKEKDDESRDADVTTQPKGPSGQREENVETQQRESHRSLERDEIENEAVCLEDCGASVIYSDEEVVFNETARGKATGVNTELHLMRERHEIEMERLCLRMMEEELNIRAKLVAAEARAGVLERERQHVEARRSPVFNAPSQGLSLNAAKFVPSAPECNANSVHGESPNNVERSNLHGDDSQGENTMKEIIREMRKPQVNIKPFKGDPIEYKRFLRQFKTCIVSNTSDVEERMSYLEQFTVGEANRIVTGYSYLDASVGYAAALRELERRYGDSEIIANAFISRALSWPVIKSDNVKGLDEFAIFLTECGNAIQSIEAVRLLEYSENLRKLVSKLPFHVHDRWRSVVMDTRDKGQVPRFNQLVTFVQREAKKANDAVYGRMSLTSEVNKRQGQPATYNSSRPTVRSGPAFGGSFGTRVAVAMQSENERTDLLSETPCVCCKDKGHSLGCCQLFVQRSWDDRITFLKSKGICFGCGKPGHRVKDCKCRAVCSKCHRRHLTILHIDRVGGHKVYGNHKKEESSRDINTSFCVGSLSCHTGAGEEGECTMAVVPVLLKAKKTVVMVQTYAFLDPGSSVSFCSEDIRQRLGLHGRKAQITLDTMGTPHRMTTHILNGLEVYDLQGTNKVDLPSVYTKDVIPLSKCHIPTKDDVKEWPHLKDVYLPQIEAGIGLLIGNSVADVYTPLEVVTGPRGTPYAARTAIGWIVWSVVRGRVPDSMVASFPVHRAEVTAVEDLQKLDQLIDHDFPEKTTEEKTEPSCQDRRFMKIVSNSIRQGPDGHYEVELPFKKDGIYLPDNKYMALQRMESLKRRMKRDPHQFQKHYTSFMKEMIEKGYAEPVLEGVAEQEGRVWYIPHHGVYHPRKPGKIRVVYDCAAKSSGVSLNDVLLQGPDLTNSLIGVLLRFRQEPTVVMADIEKMFYQVKVPEEDRDFLRFFWWADGDVNSDLRQYRMTVHLFGASSSPTCANYALRQTALDRAHKYSQETVQSVLKNFYVDDGLKSVEGPEKAVTLVRELRDLCQEGGFRLTKWMSNSKEVLQSVPVEERAAGAKDLDLQKEELPIERVLGVCWIVESDTLGFQIKIKPHPMTKRGILSTLCSVYDPLGIATPFILPAKLIIQDLCHRKVDWDDPVDEDTQRRWQKWLEDLPKLESLQVKRCVKTSDFGRVKSRQLHHFSDASQKGYGTASYLRQENDRGDVCCTLVLGKGRVAPLKRTTIPRLELTAAVIAVKMDVLLKKELDSGEDIKSYFWTDSECVLRYISSESARFRTFVANRVRIIRDGSEVQQWQYINTRINPADDASRGLKMEEFLSRERWFGGPEFLTGPQETWPAGKGHLQMMAEDPEVVITSHAIVVREDSTMEILLKKRSSWKSLKATVACLLRIKVNLQERVRCRKRLYVEYRSKGMEENRLETKVNQKMEEMRKQRNISPLNVEELEIAEEEILKYEQRKYFKSEIHSLENSTSRALVKSSPIRKLDPFLRDGLLRVGGRLGRSALHADAKHQILVPKESPVACLLFFLSQQ